MKEILEEALRRYPIGTVYISSNGGTEKTVEKQSFSIYGDNIWGEKGKEHLYTNGKWAEIVSPIGLNYQIY